MGGRVKDIIYEQALIHCIILQGFIIQLQNHKRELDLSYLGVLAATHLSHVAGLGKFSLPLVTTALQNY